MAPMGYVPAVPRNIMSLCSRHVRLLKQLFFDPQNSDYRANLRPHFKIIPFDISSLAWPDPLCLFESGDDVDGEETDTGQEQHGHPVHAEQLNRSCQSSRVAVTQYAAKKKSYPEDHP
jgi:hypothetical protein